MSFCEVLHVEHLKVLTSEMDSDLKPLSDDGFWILECFGDLLIREIQPVKFA